MRKKVKDFKALLPKDQAAGLEQFKKELAEMAELVRGNIGPLKTLLQSVGADRVDTAYLDQIIDRLDTILISADKTDNRLTEAFKGWIGLAEDVGDSLMDGIAKNLSHIGDTAYDMGEQFRRMFENIMRDLAATIIKVQLFQAVLQATSGSTGKLGIGVNQWARTGLTKLGFNPGPITTGPRAVNKPTPLGSIPGLGTSGLNQIFGSGLTPASAMGPLRSPTVGKAARQQMKGGGSGPVNITQIYNIKGVSPNEVVKIMMQNQKMFPAMQAKAAKANQGGRI